MPSGFIEFDEREAAYRRLIGLKSYYIKTAGVVSVTYTTIEKDGKADFYTIGAKGEADHVRKALDLIKDDAIMHGSSVGE